MKKCIPDGNELAGYLLLLCPDGLATQDLMF